MITRAASQQRSAAALAIALVVLMVAAAMAMGLTRLLVARHHVQAAHQRHLQAVELARAGIDRAVARLSRSEDYTGETWSVSADELRGDAATVVIEVSRLDESRAQHRITARAVWGIDQDRVQHTREMVVDRNVLIRK